jgi:hypothetical protein
LGGSTFERTAVANRPRRFGDDGLAGLACGQPCVVKDVRQHRALVGLGAGQGEADGQAVQRARQVQPQPHKWREWLAQWPYSAHPARSEGLTVSRERPRSTGVESITHTSSCSRLVSVASTRISQHMVAASLRSRLLPPDWPGGQAGEHAGQVPAGMPQPAGLAGEPERLPGPCPLITIW